MREQVSRKPKLMGQYGFTLVELLVTISVTVILLTLAVPSFQDIVQNNRLTAATNDLVGALHLTRSEAVKRGSRVTMCKSTTGNSCTDAGDWEQGWIIFTDPDNDASYTAASEELLRVRDAVEGKVVITGNTNVANYVSYVANGRPELTSGAFQAGTISICDHRNENVGRDVVMGRSGRLRIEKERPCP